MKPKFINHQVIIPCPGCGGAVSTYERSKPGGQGECGSTIEPRPHDHEGLRFNRIIYRLYRCAGCGRGGLAEIHDNGQEAAGVLGAFYPRAAETAPVPGTVPEGVLKEFREAELCASFEAWRAASALLRSVLEKTLKANGYAGGNLKERIDRAATDGVITAARSKRAHDDIRVLGNDVLHDEWREVTEEEVTLAHHYAHRILEDLYDHRSEVEAILRAKGRIT